MAERALLLIECIANYTEGSNPSHSLKTVSLTKTEIRGAIKDRNADTHCGYALRINK